MSRYLIKNVNVIPILSEEILEEHDVLIVNDRIARIAENIDDGEATKIEATGKYLLPGLTDMHVHIIDENALKLLVANGVTTIRNLWGKPCNLAWRKQIANDNLISPYMYTTNPLTDGSPPAWNGSYIVTNSTEAKTCVKDAIESGYDQIKVYNRLTKEAYDALVKEAESAGIKITGHIPNKVGLRHALNSAQYCIEHLDGYIESSMSEEAEKNKPEQSRDYVKIFSYFLEHYDEKIMKNLVSLTKSKGVWNCATLVVNNRGGRPSKTEQFLQEESMKYVSKARLTRWDPKTDFRSKNIDKKVEEYIERLIELEKLLLAELKNQGAKILFGTDTGNPFVVPGFSIHEEFRLFSEAGFSNYEVLKIATLEAAEFMESNDFGSITEGKRADLVLLDSNPLDNLANLQNPYGVFLRGKWLDRTYLDEVLREMKEMYAYENRWFQDLNPEELGDNYLNYNVILNGNLTHKSRMKVNDAQIILHTSDGISESQIRCCVDLKNGKPVSYELTLFLNSLKTELKITQEEDQWNVEFIKFDGKIEITRLPANIPIGFLDIVNFLLLPEKIYQLNEGKNFTFEQNTLEVDMSPLVTKASVNAKKNGEMIELEYKAKNKEVTYRLWCDDKQILRKLEMDGQFGLSTISLVEE